MRAYQALATPWRVTSPSTRWSACELLQTKSSYGFSRKSPSLTAVRCALESLLGRKLSSSLCFNLERSCGGSMGEYILSVPA